MLDAFVGNSTTLLAAEKTGRRGYGIELDPYYVDLVIQRFSDLYGLKAAHVDSKLSFDRLRSQRTKVQIEDKIGKARKADKKGKQARSKRQ